MFWQKYYKLKIVQSKKDMDYFKKCFLKSNFVYFDTETTGLMVRAKGVDYSVGYTFAFDDRVTKDVFYIPLEHEFEGVFEEKGRFNFLDKVVNGKSLRESFPDFCPEKFEGNWRNQDKKDFISLLSYLIFSKRRVYIAHNISFDLHTMQTDGIDIERFFRTQAIFDTMVAVHSIDEDMDKKLEKLVMGYFQIPKADYDMTISTVTPEEKKLVGLKSTNKASFQHVQIPIGAYYSGEDVWFMKALTPAIVKALIAENQKDFYFNYRIPHLKSVWRMEREGAYVNLKRLEQMKEDAKVELENLTYRIYEIAGVKININSSEQLATLLFSHKKCRRKMVDKKWTGEYSTTFDEAIMEKSFGFPVLSWTDGGADKDKKCRSPKCGSEDLDNLLSEKCTRRDNKEGYELIRLLIKYKKLEKLRSAFIEGLPKHIYPDGRLHPSFNICGCITGDSLIPTTEGLKEIKDICPNTKDSEFVEKRVGIVNRYSKVESTSHFVKYKNRETIKITLPLGLSLEGTTNHPVMSNLWNKKQCSFNVSTRKKALSDSSYVWKQLQELVVGDLVCVPYGYNVFGSNLQEFEVLEPTHLTNTKQGFKFPKKMSMELAEFLGIYYADGCISDSNGSFSILISNQDTEVIERVQYLSKYLFGIKARVNDNHTTKMIIINTINLQRYESILELQRGCVNKMIPSFILNAPKEIVASFIKGLTLDSCLIREKNKTYLKFTFSNKKVAKQLQAFLFNMGIICSYREDKKNSNTFNILIYNDFYNLFLEEIGVIQSKKKEYFAGSVKHNYIIDTDKKVIWLPVKDIISSINDVYDFTVPDTHSFVSNCIISHNTVTYRLSCDSPK